MFLGPWYEDPYEARMTIPQYNIAWAFRLSNPCQARWALTVGSDFDLAELHRLEKILSAVLGYFEELEHDTSVFSINTTSHTHTHFNISQWIYTRFLSSTFCKLQLAKYRCIIILWQPSCGCFRHLASVKSRHAYHDMNVNSWHIYAHREP